MRFSNKLAYTFIVFGIIAFLVTGVNALTPGVKPNPGHLISEVAPTSPCASNYFLKFDGSNWVCSAETGDIESVTVAAGSGLTGGGTSGAVTIDTDSSALQKRVTGTCAGQVMVGINSVGGVTCEPDDSGGGGGGWADDGSVIRLETSSDSVGIGTSTPGTYKLSVYGNGVKISGAFWC